MAKIGIFYGSTNGVTEDIAQMIGKKLGDDATVHDIASASKDDLQQCDLLIFGTSTWGDGDIQDDWYDFIDDLDLIDYMGKKVALFGLGDQEGYPETFVDGIGTLYDKLKENSAEVIGEWAVDGYEYDGSTAEREGKFVGLPLDEDNQPELTEERVDQWLELLKAE